MNWFINVFFSLVVFVFSGFAFLFLLTGCGIQVTANV